jgi:hypothetical protein
VNTWIEVVGIYPVESEQPVHLVELIVHNCNGSIDMLGITQEAPRQPRDDWQVPYEERILDESGSTILAVPSGGSPEIWEGDVRLAFFFHYLDLSQPLQTPFGALSLPKLTPMPERLMTMPYIPVD